MSAKHRNKIGRFSYKRQPDSPDLRQPGAKTQPRGSAFQATSLKRSKAAAGKGPSNLGASRSYTWSAAQDSKVSTKTSGAAVKPLTASAAGSSGEATAAAAARLLTPPVPSATSALQLSVPKYGKQRPNQLVRISPRGAQRNTVFTGPQAPFASSRPQPPPAPARQLVHRGRHSLVRASIISAAARTVAAVRTPTVAKSPTTWLRPGAARVSPPGLQAAAAARTRSSRPMPRSQGKCENLKWQRVNPLRAPPPAAAATPLLRGGSASRRRHSQGQRRLPAVPRSATNAPGKLVRIGGTLYRVAGSGRGSSLRRQVTPRVVQRTPLTQAVRYRRHGHSLQMMRSVGKSGSGSKQHILQKLRTGVPAKQLLLATPPSRRPAKAKLGIVAAIRKRSQFVNRLCIIYCRTGKCIAKDRGVCSLVHDAAKVAVCPKWLAGRCSDPACSQQHTPRPDLMPLCMHFLKGSCSNTDCPYLHVRLDPQAPACKAFLQGHCPRGAACPHKHLTARMLKELRSTRVLAAAANAILPQEQHRTKRMGAPSQQERHAKRPATEPREQGCHGTVYGQGGDSEEDLMRPAFLRGLL